MERWPIMSGKRLIGHIYYISIDFISMEIYSFRPVSILSLIEAASYSWNMVN